MHFLIFNIVENAPKESMNIPPKRDKGTIDVRSLLLLNKIGAPEQGSKIC